MNEIIARVYTSDQAEDFVITLLETGHFIAQKAIIHYNVEHGLPPANKYEEYPLVLEGLLNRVPSRILVYSVSAGYSGSGPHALITILRAAGFSFNEDDILTKRLRGTKSDPDSIDIVYIR